MVGGRVEGYQITSKLGEGGMGEVWLGVGDDGRRVAIKLLQREHAGQAEAALRFRREAEATRRLRHPNIVELHAVGQLEDGRLYLVMELVDGPSLHQVLCERGVLPLAQALPILQQLADAIDHAHAHGVVHRDLKPENLLLVGGGERLKVLDFGVAKIIASDHESIGLTRDGEVFGSVMYMSPEQCAGDGRDPRIDIYAFGCVAHELVTGQPPFTGRTMEIMRAHLFKAPQPPSLCRPELGLPAELDELVLRCLAKRPAERYQTGRELRAALERVPVPRAATAAPSEEGAPRLHAAATVQATALRALSPARLRQLGEALVRAGETDVQLRVGVERLGEIERALEAAPESPALARELDVISSRLRERLPPLVSRWAHVGDVLALVERLGRA